MRIGWRLGCRRIDSSRLSVSLTGRPVTRASSAVCAWTDMSSLPPNAPPLGTRVTKTCSCGRARNAATWRRSSKIPCPWVWRWSLPSGRGSASALSGSRYRCSIRCVCHVPRTTCALDDSAASASPRRIDECERTLSCFGLTRGAPRRDRGLRVEHRGPRLVVHLHEPGRLSRGVPIDGSHGRQHVADAPRLLALRDEPRPVVFDQAVPTLAGHVGRGHDSDDAGVRPGLRRVDAADERAGVRRQDKGTVQQAGPVEVVHIRPLAERRAHRVVARQPRADAAVLLRFGNGLAPAAAGHPLDRIDDLLVARAAAEVDVDGARNLVARRARVAVEQVFRPERDARDAEAALHAGGDRERA